jgi:hypothetical protein
MLQLAATPSAAKPDESQAKKLIAGLNHLREELRNLEKAGEYNADDVETVRAQFRGPGWSRVVGVQSKKDGENAEVFLRLDKDGRSAGSE